MDRGRGRGRWAPPVILTDEERSYLEAQLRIHKMPQRMAKRYRIILRCAEGMSDLKVAEKAGVCVRTVGKWRKRFLASRLDGLTDCPRSGRPPTITPAQVDEMVSKTLLERPADSTHWSTRSMARETGISHTSVGRIWRARRLRPHKSETHQISNDEDFKEKGKV